MPAFIDDTRYSDYRKSIRSRGAQETGNLGLILIDYLQLITGTGRENRQQEFQKSLVN